MKPKPLLYANRQWAVTPRGLECLTTSYAIEADRLGERRPGDDQLLDWPLRMAEKGWLDYGEFVDAFRQAITLHRDRIPSAEEVTADQLELSVAKGARLYKGYHG